MIPRNRRPRTNDSYAHIIEAHEETLKNDPERLSIEFIRQMSVDKEKGWVTKCERI